MSTAIKDGPKYVGFFWRAIALALDNFFWIILQIPLVPFFNQFENSELLTAVYLLAFLAYFWLLPKFGRATLGQYMMGYRIVPADESRPKCLWRLAYVCGTAIMWPLFLFSWFMLRNDDIGIYWWDRKSSTRAVSTRQTN
ncbi:MAG: RDD family protein [Litorimonas sp.]